MMLLIGLILQDYHNTKLNLVKFLIKGEKAIDGSCIFLLEEEDLKDDVKVESNIVRKKLINWTKTILLQYANYLI